MKQQISRQSFLFLLLLFLLSCQATKKDDRLAKASRENKNGWIYVHLEGSPSNIGYQHGYLLADEIDTTLQMFQYFLPHNTKRDWKFYRQCAQSFMWNKLEPEYKEEINGIVAGLHAKKKIMIASI